MHIHRVAELLTRTDFPLATIARLAGFAHVESMARLFHRRTGQTP